MTTEATGGRMLVVLGLTSWAILARVIRAEVLSIRQRGYVEAAVAVGSSDLRIMRRTILPNALPTVIVFLTLLLGQVVLRHRASRSISLTWCSGP